MVTALVGTIVAMVSGVFGISAHGLAAGPGAGSPETGQILLVVAASAAVGVVTATLARTRAPMAVAASGLIAGQGLVHLALVTGHAHGAAAHSTPTGTAAGAIGHHVTDPAAVRAAMDGAALDAATSPAALLSPGMLGAHAAAILATLALVAILSGALAWVAARVTPLPATAHLVVVAPVIPSYDAAAPRGRFLLGGGGTRAPPVAV